MNKRALIIDCDPGVDDAVALFLAFASPELEVLGVTTVAGNVGVELTTRNARLIREIAGRPDVPVAPGASRPLMRQPVEAGHFHGESGLGDLPVFEPKAPAEDRRAAAFIVETVMRRSEGEVTLAVVGPMTNVALAMALEPAIVPRLREVVVMGGAKLAGGNITASSEYNIHADPHAAQIVAQSGAQVAFFGLDATHQVRATEARIAAVEVGGGPVREAAAALLRFSSAKERSHGIGDGGAALHDPCPIAYLIAPELFTLRHARIAVETASPLTLGHTAVEMRLAPGETPPTRWAVSADGDGVFRLLAERL